MPVLRKRPYRRKTYRRRRPGLRRRRTMRVGRPLATSRSLLTHRYKRMALLYGQGGAISSLIGTTVGATAGYASIAFNNYITQIPQYSEFTNLYDYFKLTFVVYKVTWLSTTLTAIETSSTAVGAPIMYYHIDRDDVTAFPNNAAGLQDMRANTRTKRFTFTPNRRTCTFKFKPNTLIRPYVSALTSGYSIQYNAWQDCDVDVPYYGTKIMFHTPSPGDNPTVANYFEIEATYYLIFKQPR